MGLTLFFDTYAIIEIIAGNPTYSAFSNNLSIITSRLNLMELHYILLRNNGSSVADFYFSRFSEFAIDFDNETIKAANRFRLENKGKKLSYADCIGYILAKKSGARFLTGDNAFRGLDDVEFAK